jgi:hypothetical protein
MPSRANIVVVLPACNAARTLWVMLCFLLCRCGLFRARVLEKTLPEVANRHCHENIFRK